jgi:hypothetical protein
VFIHWNPPRQPWEEWRYTPIFATLGQAFFELGASVALTNADDTSILRSNITALSDKGVKPIVIIVGFQNHRMAESMNILRDISTKAHIILYQSEPMAIKPHEYSLVQDAVSLFKASEVWDYSMANMQLYKTNNASFTSRFMPPGASTYLDANVSFAQAGRTVESLAFLGQRRPPPNMTMKTKVQMAPRIENNIELRNFLEQNPVQVVYHRVGVLAGGRLPVESFRIAQLLTNKACVISLRSHIDDERMFEGIVRFTNDIDQEFEKVSRDIRGCQMNAYHEYMRRWAPSELLANAGFTKVWHEMNK